MKSFAALVPALGMIGAASAWTNETTVWTTKTVQTLTTFCPSATTLTYGYASYDLYDSDNSNALPELSHIPRQHRRRSRSLIVIAPSATLLPALTFLTHHQHQLVLHHHHLLQQSCHPLHTQDPMAIPPPCTPQRPLLQCQSQSLFPSIQHTVSVSSSSLTPYADQIRPIPNHNPCWTWLNHHRHRSYFVDHHSLPLYSYKARCRYYHNHGADYVLP